MISYYLVTLVLFGALVSLVLLWRSERDERKGRERELKRIDLEFSKFKEGFKGVVDAQAERERILSDLKAEVLTIQNEKLNLQLELDDLAGRIPALKAEFASLDEQANMQSFGFYRPHYDFADSERFQSKLEEIRENQKGMLKSKTAATADQEWTINGSKTEGRKQTNQYLKLMLRGFNGECDSAVAKVKYNNVEVMETRIKRAFDSINGMAEVQQCRITREFLNLKLQELYLAHEYQEKVQAEKEEQRRIREQMREEELAQREIEKAMQMADEEEKRYAAALQKAREEVERSTGTKHEKLTEQIAALEQKLSEAQSNKERARSRAQMTRSGHVYVISNIGSFGEHVYKIGMTRRLEPLDRVKELGDASVPFAFDVHAMIFSEDAPALENKLHKAIESQRVNLVNDRKEFFAISIDQIVDVVAKHCGQIEFTRVAKAEDYRRSLAVRGATSASRGEIIKEIPVLK